MEGSIDPTKAQISVPTSTIVYNDSNPVTSLYIYEYSSNELITRSFLAGDEFSIYYSPTAPPDMGNLQRLLLEGLLSIINFMLL